MRKNLCAGFTPEETEDALIQLNYLGIRNVMALQGDPHGARRPSPDRTENVHALELVGQIAAMNRGQYLHDLADAAPTDFCIGVAGYPERHFDAPNTPWDIGFLQRKVDAGAHYVVTRMFFRNERYFDFVSRCRAMGIGFPILPGLKILSSKAQLTSLPRTFHVEIPEELTAEVQGAPDDRVVDIGVEWAVAQANELLARGAPGVHFYILQSSREITPRQRRDVRVGPRHSRRAVLAAPDDGRHRDRDGEGTGPRLPSRPRRLGRVARRPRLHARPRTATWTQVPAAGSTAPPGAADRGTFGRWRYVASLDVFVVVNSADTNVFVYRLP